MVIGYGLLNFLTFKLIKLTLNSKLKKNVL